MGTTAAPTDEEPESESGGISQTIFPSQRTMYKKASVGCLWSGTRPCLMDMVCDEAGPQIRVDVDGIAIIVRLAGAECIPQLPEHVRGNTPGLIGGGLPSTLH